MNEPNSFTDPLDHDEAVARMKKIHPRGARVDMDAILAASQSNQPSYVHVPVSPRRFRPWSHYAATWCAGMAAGAAVAVLAMHWLVLRDLRATIQRLESNSPSMAQSHVEPVSTHRAMSTRIGPSFDLKELLNAPKYSVHSYRRVSYPMRSNPPASLKLDSASPRDSQNAPPLDVQLPTQLESPSAPEPPASVTSRNQLLQVLKQDIH